MTPEEREIRQVHTAWIAAVDAGDLGQLLDSMTDDAVFLSPGRAPVRRAEFSADFSAAHEQAEICCKSELEEVVVVGEVAYTRSRDAVSATPRGGGETTQLWGYRMTVYRKCAAGRWRLARDVHTLTPASGGV